MPLAIMMTASLPDSSPNLNLSGMSALCHSLANPIAGIVNVIYFKFSQIQQPDLLQLVINYTNKW